MRSEKRREEEAWKQMKKRLGRRLDRERQLTEVTVQSVPTYDCSTYLRYVLGLTSV